MSSFNKVMMPQKQYQEEKEEHCQNRTHRESSRRKDDRGPGSTMEGGHTARNPLTDSKQSSWHGTVNSVDNVTKSLTSGT